MATRTDNVKRWCVVGMDQSLTSTALACVDSTGRIVQMHMIKVKSRGVQRLIEIEHEVIMFVRTHPPALMFMEDYAFGKNKQAHQMGELGGVLKVALNKSNVRCYSVAPTRLKKYITGKGTGDKTPLIAAITKKHGHTFDKDDEYDAFGLAEMARCFRIAELRQLPLKLTAYERDVLADQFVSIDQTVPESLVMPRAKQKRSRKKSMT